MAGRSVNYDLYRSLKDADELRQGTRERVARYRARKALERSTGSKNHPVTPVTRGNKSNATAEAEAKADPDAGIPLTRDTEPARTEEDRLRHADSGRQGKPLTRRPTKQQAQRFFSTKGFKSDPETFFNHYESVGWTDPQGRPIVNWRALAIDWEKREPSMSSGTGRAKHQEPATDYEAEMGALAEEAEALRARKDAKEGS